MVTTLERPTAFAPARLRQGSPFDTVFPGPDERLADTLRAPEGPTSPAYGEATELARAVLQAVVSGQGGTFTVDAPDAATVTRVATPIRLWLLLMRLYSGGVSATVSPSFFGDTYPAMLGLIYALGKADLGDAWRPDGVRTVRLEQAAHIFVSADRPVIEPPGAPGPDTLLEVTGAHTLGLDWYMDRVAPRATSPGLTRVFYGLPGARGSAYEHMRHRRPGDAAQPGPRRHFSLLDAASDVRLSPPGGGARRPTEVPA